tara:strand:+ start:576 stop:920 length:345 start_codon:yes stop_codon:yes gene_type:complete
MPKLPKAKQRPWIPKKPQHLREVDNASFYNSKRWRALRNYFIQKNPLCAQCKRDGKVKGAQCVDHIKPISMGGSMIDQKNLQSLCNSCHAKKSGREGAEKRNNVKTYKNKKNVG